jgi:hypothetical protein
VRNFDYLNYAVGFETDSEVKIKSKLILAIPWNYTIEQDIPEKRRKETY